LHLVESKPPLPLAYINPATPCTHEFGKREAAFYPQPSPDPSKGLTQIQTSKGPNGISVLPVSYCVIIVSVPWLMKRRKRESK
jgi:hypothetical protein